MTLDHCDPQMTQSINCPKLSVISLFINLKGGQQEKPAEKLQILVGQPSHGVGRCWNSLQVTGSSLAGSK